MQRLCRRRLPTPVSTSPGHRVGRSTGHPEGPQRPRPPRPDGHSGCRGSVPSRLRCSGVGGRGAGGRGRSAGTRGLRAQGSVTQSSGCGDAAVEDAEQAAWGHGVVLGDAALSESGLGSWGRLGTRKALQQTQPSSAPCHRRGVPGVPWWGCAPPAPQQPLAGAGAGRAAAPRGGHPPLQGTLLALFWGVSLGGLPSPGTCCGPSALDCPGWFC